MKIVTRKMKQKTTIFLGMVAFACLTIAPVTLTKTVYANESIVENITWNNEELYVAESLATEMPKTIETWLQLDMSVKATAGTVLGNYGASTVFGRYEYPTQDIYNFEISEKGKPRIYMQSPDGYGESIVFNNVDVRGAEFVHLSVTLDDGVAKCYLNGVLSDTVSYDMEEFVSAYQYAVGGDYRVSAGKYTNYFPGELKSVSVYSDVRTQSEILADMSVVNANDAKLMFAYDLTGKAGSESIEDASINENNLVRTWLWEENIEQSDYAYSMVAIGDTQKANIYGKADGSGINFDAIYDYIAENAEEDKMKFVFGLGDITDESYIWEFEKAKRNWEKLDDIVPYSLVRGNHDYAKISDVPTNVSTTKSSFEETWGVNSGSTYSNQYFATYDNTALHTAHKFSVGNLDYLVIVLSWAPTDAEIAWANDIVAAHPYHNVIVTTHGFTDANGEILEYWSDKGKNYADKIWDNFIKKHENIVLVLSGHITSKRIEYYTLQGENGNTVTQLLIDPSWLDTDMQSSNPKGAGLIANLCFSSDGSQVDVNWYSPIQQKYYNSESVYSFTINTVARQQLSASVKGNGGSLIPERTEINGDPINVKIQPEKNYHLIKLTLDGEDVTENVVNGVYTLTKTSGELQLIAEFDEDDKYSVAVNNAQEKGEVTITSSKQQYFIGEVVSFKITPKSGYKVASVLYNGTAIIEEDGEYTLTITGANDELTVQYAEVSIEPIVNEPIEEKGGWGVGIALSSVGVVIIGAGIAFAFIFKKKKEKN